MGHIPHRAAGNIGTRPTVTQETHRTVEAHLLDFDKDLYDLNIAVDYFERLRGEEKFASVQELTAHIHSDVETVRKILSDHVMRDA